MEEVILALQIAMEAGIVNVGEVRDLIARASQRRKHATLERVSKALDEGATEAEFLAVVEKPR